MIEKDIVSKGPKKRDPACVQLQDDIVIPRGTILRQEAGRQDKFEAPASFGKFLVDVIDVHAHPEIYKLVISA